MRKLITFLFIISTSAAFAQLAVVVNKDTTRYASKKDYNDKHDSKEGYWIQYSTAGKVLSQGLYKSDEKEGLWKEYYENGNLKSEIPYIGGKAEGYTKMYYENGNLSEEGNWKNKAWTGNYKYYFENGNPSYAWKFDENGKRTGIQQYFYENGNKMIEGEWQSGKESGIIKEFHENGSLKSETNYNDGQVDVASMKMYEPTKTQPQDPSLDHFDGNGYFKTINKWRKPEYEGIWKAGKFMDGKKYIYNDEGKYETTLIYRNGVKVGEKQEK